MNLLVLKNNKAAFLLLILLINKAWAQIPLLNSVPSATKVIYLDFDGEVVTGTPWNANPNQTITALPSTMNSAGIINIWKRMVEDYRPFDVTITTDVAVFNAAPSTRRIRVIVTPTSAWYGAAGGVAYVGSFNWGGNPATPCWVFENQLAYNTKYIAEAGSHEVGHTMTLRHQSTWDMSCVKTAEYNPGLGTGVISWAPIMGVGYYKNVTIWHSGTNTSTCTTIQNDHGNVQPGITSANYLSFIPDDIGDVQATAKTLTLNTTIVLDSGIISQPTDIDAFKFAICNNRYITFNIQPWALDTVNYDAANLDISFQLYDSNNNLLLSNNSPTALRALAGMSLTTGSYYFTIDGVGSANYTDYGSLGRYYVKVKSSNVPAITSGFTSPTVICQGQAATFLDASTGTPIAWNWSALGASPATSTVNNPTFTYSNSGTYTVSLSASNGTVSSCGITKTITVNASPALTVTGNNAICIGSSINITASGASGYTWNPGGINTPTFTDTPLVSVIYTVTGNTNGCYSSSIVNTTVNPLPSLTVTASQSTVCSDPTGASTLALSASPSGGVFSGVNVVGNILTVPANSGTVYANYSYTNPLTGCSNVDSVQIIVNECTGIAEFEKLDLFSIYPNPNKGVFIIKATSNDFYNVELYNSIGQKIVSLNNLQKSNEIDLEGKFKGIYFLMIKTLKGTARHKIILE